MSAGATSPRRWRTSTSSTRAHRKGTALGLNAAGGNLGVAVIQFFLPLVVGAAGVFGLVKASEAGFALQRAGYLYAGLALLAAAGAYLFMNNLTAARSKPREQLAVLRYKHTWVMSFLYIGTFGSFIGYSAAMPLLIKLNFSVTDPATGVVTGINFAYYAFLGALVGSIARPFGGWLADRYGGARVTLWTFVAMIAGTLAVLWTLSALAPNPTADPAVATANQSLVPVVPGRLPLRLRRDRHRQRLDVPDDPADLAERRRVTSARPAATEREAAMSRATKESSAVIGIAGAIGALGGFLIPMTFGAPWIDNPVDAVQTAFGVFTGFYVVCLAVTWFFYTRTAFVSARLPQPGRRRHLR